MPSSGSTTSFIASVTSSTVTVAVPPPVRLGDLGQVAVVDGLVDGLLGSVALLQ